MARPLHRCPARAARRVPPRLGCVLLAVLAEAAGCASWSLRGSQSRQAAANAQAPDETAEAEPAPTAKPSAAEQQTPGSPSEQSPGANPSAELARAEARRSPPQTDPREVAKAKRLVTRGLVAYGKGNYDRAEVLLKEAISTYPFLPRANLTLGKIFLIRGSADRDPTLISSARLMFEMARALDPTLREPDALLELFRLPSGAEPESEPESEPD